MPLCEYTNIFTDVIQMILVIIKNKEMVGKTIDVILKMHNGK